MDLASIFAALSERITHLVYAVVVLCVLVAIAVLLGAWNALTLRRERALRIQREKMDDERWEQVTRAFPKAVPPRAPQPPPLQEFFGDSRATSPSPLPDPVEPRGTVLPSPRRR